MSKAKTVTDQNGVQYELAELLGRGGQGAVYSVKGGRLAVKLIASGDSVQRDRIRNQLTFVKRLPLGDLALAKPLEMLRPPHTGYVMELLTGMEPVQRLLKPTKGQTSLVEWYLASGGLRRRLTLLAKASQALAQLHGKGLAYSDLSPTNIFVSSSLDAHEVRFIDADNLRYESGPSVKPHGVFTPGYGAPELVLGRSGVTTLSDAYALAVLIFQTLTLTHPFIGDLVNDGEPDLEEQAFSGHLPWIEDTDDKRNRASFGIPRAWVLSSRLMESCHQAFGAGRTEPTARPGASEWAEKLYAAAEATIDCQACSGSYYFKEPRCPWCNGDRPTFATAGFYLWDPEIGPDGGIVTKMVDGRKHSLLLERPAITDGQTLNITRRLALGYSAQLNDELVVSVSLEGNQVKIRSLDGNVYELVSTTKELRSKVSDRPKVVKLEEGRFPWLLHFAHRDTLHRVVSFELRKGAQS